MKKTALSLLAFASAAVTASSQSVEDGVKLLYYQKNTSAIAALKKAVADKPKDPLAIYWLGQAYIANDVAGKVYLDSAKSLYQAKLTEGVNDPWLWIGMGHVELLTGGDLNAAKQKFEQAITTTTPTKGKHKNEENIDVLNAIGRANADGSSKEGDAQYGIDKLKRAVELMKADEKTKPNPDVYINLGTCYLKQGSDKGGEAVEAFREAFTADPANAQAAFRIGRIYQSQNNLESMNEWYGKAIAADAAFAPVYIAYFNYYKERDVNAAKEYLDKYVANADQDCETDFFVADYLFRAGKYQESLQRGQAMEAGPCKDFPKVQALYAFNYLRLNDSVKAKAAIEKYFTVADPALIEPEQYVLGGSVLKKFPGSEDAAASYFKKAQELDTALVNRIKYQDSIVSVYRKTKDSIKILDAVYTGFKMTPSPTNRDIFDLGDAALKAKKLDLSDSAYTLYIEKYPDQPYGYIGRVKVAQARDTTGAAAIGPMNNYISFLMKDTVKNGSTIGYYYALMGGYYANYASNLDSSILMFEKAVQYDPANSQYPAFLKQLTDARDKANRPRTQPAAKPKKAASGKK
ncbi:tetratricopeptide repeat protein [Foetidibacter luteolus]|uniref:tetratricopeptide repeat protein n=1 Tax=Foetidibacter luteolus TaxID=2608880 RepID=UPI00129BF461|nr:hypothetical protein [Foetidibacter luteolus]